jgi:hypothetical protein
MTQTIFWEWFVDTAGMKKIVPERKHGLQDPTHLGYVNTQAGIQAVVSKHENGFSSM